MKVGTIAMEASRHLAHLRHGPGCTMCADADRIILNLDRVAMVYGNTDVTESPPRRDPLVACAHPRRDRRVAYVLLHPCATGTGWERTTFRKAQLIVRTEICGVCMAELERDTYGPTT